ncbi:MAG: amino acid adenylation domain-containing protein, partial [Pyrinomonadaceae bacterium]
MNSPEMTLLGGHLEREQEYWLGKLSGPPSPAGLPLDFARAPGAGPRAGRVEATFGAATAEKLYKAAGANSSLVFAVLVAALKVCLHKYTGEEEITVGTAIHTRHAEDAALNRVLALRDRVRGTTTVRQLLADVKQTLAGAYAHQKLPFARMCELLGVTPADEREPLFDVVILLEDINDPSHVAGLKNDLTLTFSAGESRLAVTVEYRPELFERGTVELFARRVELALAAMLDHPDDEIDALNLLADGEREQLLYEFNDTASDYPRDLTIHQLFAQQAALTPDAVAVVYGSDSLSYRELDARAELLAARLRAHGVGPERVVALCLERSAEMVVALLAILKAGGAYLPLDPADPPARLSRLLADSGAILLLSESRLAARLPETATPTLLLDADASDVSPASGAGPGAADFAEVAATNLAYVLFTSGSTGTPKAVGVEHRAVVRLVRGTGYAEFGPSEVFLQLAPLAFDASTFELWGPLLNGGRLIVMPPGAPSLDDIAAALRQHGVTTLWLTAGLFHLMAERRPAALRGLRQLLAGGDVLSPARVREFVAGGGSRLINGYGPTEGTTFTCCHEVGGAGEVGASVPIGRPIANTKVYVLDGRMRPAPVGMRGELYIGGDGLARGYLGNAKETAARFVPDPFSTESGAQLYRTGDFARQRADGVVEFLGRRDNQVKVRGFRVEPGEVEAALREHTAVNECAVVVRADETGEGRLVGYVARRAGHEVSAEELREYLAGRVPRYMMPAVVMVLERLPLTANGKVNRAALPEVTAERPDGAGERPVGEIEEVIARLWEQVLGVEGVGRRENFFELGGHSLRATQLMSRVRETFGVQVSLVVLFEQPTVADLAAAVEDALRADSSLTAPPVVAAPRTGPLPLSFAQQRLWFLDRLMPEAASYNVPVAYRIEGRLDVNALERSLNRIVERHEVLRTTIAVIGAEPSQIVRPESPLTLEHADLAGLTEDARAEAVRREIESESRRTFDLERGPVIRARLLRLAEEEHVLVITMHHIVADGWSVGVLARELSAFYEAEARGAEARLPELPVQYADYAAWQRAWLQGEELERQLDYWRGQLAGAPTVLELPADHPRPKMQTGRGGVERFEVGGEVLDGLQTVGREEGAT